MSTIKLDTYGLKSEKDKGFLVDRFLGVTATIIGFLFNVAMLGLFLSIIVGLFIVMSWKR